MKLTLFSSLLCLALGFFLGHKASPPSPDLSPPPVTQSYREPRTGRPAREKSSSQHTASKFTSPDYSRLSGERHMIFEAKVHGSLATLTLDEIPEVLDYFFAKENRENYNEPPWDASPEMLILLARWYELEGEGVLDWIENHSVWTRESVLKAKALTILDGFHRNPDQSFQKLLELKNSVHTDDPFHPSYLNYSRFHEDILYEIGRWSGQPFDMLQQLDPKGGFQIVYESSTFPPQTDPRPPRKLPLGMGFPVTQGSPTSFSTNSEMEALARGLIDAGRHQLARDFRRDLQGGSKDAFQQVLGEEAAKQGWQEVKRQIDQGVLDLSILHGTEVLSEFAKINRQSALDWYLNLPNPEGVTREYQIAEAVTSSGAFQILLPQSDDPFAANEKIDLSAALDWLKEMQRQGEPVEKATSILHYEAIQLKKWQILKDLHQSLPTGELQHLKQDIIHTSINPREESFRGEQFIWSDLSDSADLGAAEAFGLLDQVHAKAEEINAHSRAALRTLLEKLEAEAAQ